MKRSVAVLAIVAAAGVANANVLFNEFFPNPVGGDPATTPVELIGTPGDTISGMIYEVDTDFSPGQTIDRAEAFSGTFDANGLLVVTIADFENPSATYILASGGSASTGTVFDLGNVGTQMGTIWDAVNSADSAGDGANSVAGLLGGTDLGFTGGEPELIFRDSISLEWIQMDNFDVFLQDGTLVGAQDDIFPGFGGSNLAITGTFGAINPTLVPAPASLALLGLGGLVATRRRR